MRELDLAPERTPVPPTWPEPKHQTPGAKRLSPAWCAICGRPGASKRVLAGDEVEFRKCACCGVVSRVPLLLPPELQEYFAESYITTEASLEDSFGKRREEILSLCAAAIEKRKTSGRILDVGCAGGYFLNHFFRADGWERFGVEPSRFAARNAVKSGIEIYPGQVCTVALPPGFFDVITLLDVLYYFTDPKSDLQTLRRSLQPNGMLVIEVPLGFTQLLRHHTGVGRALGGHPVSPLQRRHNYLFSAKSLVSLLERAGFEVQEMWSLPGVRQPSGLQHLVHRAYYSASRLVARVSNSRLIGGPNCLVIARPR